MSGGWKVGQVQVKVGGLAMPRVAPSMAEAERERADLAAIQQALQGRDLDRAAELAQAAHSRGMEHPLVLNLTALKLEKEERFGEALKVLQRAVEIAPADFAARNALGLCLHRLERPAEALEQFDKVLEDQPDFGGAHASRGAALESLGRLIEAEAAYRRALELQPDNLGAVAGLANLASRRGAHAEARPLAERVLAAVPDYPDAVMALAAADLAEGAHARAAARLETLAADPRATAVQRALAKGLLGDVRDAQGLVADAFAAYQACNSDLARAYAPRFAGADALTFARAMLQTLETAGPETWPAPAPTASAARRHVFLLGFPRSGTTLLEQVLASHPDVEALEERETLADASRAFLAEPTGVARLASASDGELDDLRAAYWSRVAAEGAQPAGKVFVDKHPLNTFRLPLIARLFPDAVILLARRDPRDVVLAAWRRRFVMSGSAYQLLTLPGTAGYYDAAMRIAERFAPSLGERLHVVRHESLVEDFDSVVPQVCAAIGLTFTPAMRAFSDRTRDRGIATPTGAQLAGGLSAEGLGAWRRYAEPLGSVLPVLAPWVERFGYAPE
ncbi:tetratricopeptide repeat-containing sulfotransferase family protein [Phenylobacterium sp.]|uniref:tetratricopeptide repeat-containing sulfotransferase family protein n=1 Tax=Phenylobacterium sp. TaxID=1871053 RepID=UPI002F95AA37